jgi:hypothetical protein
VSEALTLLQVAATSLVQPRKTRAMRAQSQQVQQAVEETEGRSEDMQTMGSKCTATPHSEQVQKRRRL